MSLPANRHTLVSLAFAGLLAGCSTTPPRESFEKTKDDLTARIGATPAWPLDDEEDRKVSDETTRLLSGNIDASTAVRIALLNNRHIRETLEETGISQAEADQAGFLPNPTFTGSARWPDSKPRGPNVELSLAFDFLDAVLIPLRQRIADENFAKVRAHVAQELLVRVAETREAFYTCVAKTEIRGKIGFMAKLNDASLDFAKRRFDAGNINRLELEQFAAMAAQSHVDLVRADADARIAREKVNRALGLSGARAAEWKTAEESPGLPDADPDTKSLEDKAVAMRPDLSAARTDVNMAGHALSLKEDTRFFPAGVNVGVDTERETDGARVTGPSLSLALPIFDQGQAEVARLKAVVRKLKDREAALENDIRAEVRIACERLAAARANATYYRDTLLPARRNVTREMLYQYNAMSESPFELLAARMQQQQAERDAVEAALDYRLARVALDLAVGGLLPEDGAKQATVKKETPDAEGMHRHTR